MGSLFLVRHADAGVRDGSGPDRDRELSERGWRQAGLLADQLAHVGIKRVLASPFVRCVQTVAPLAERLGLSVEREDRLAEGSRFEDVLILTEELRGDPAALCSHGDVIPDVLEALVRRGMRLADDARWPKASTWVLERDKDDFATARYLAPPT